MDNLNIIIGISNLSTAIIIMAVCIPLLLKKMPMNSMYGFRLSKSFRSNENWYAINSYGAKHLIIWSSLLGVLGIVCFFLPPMESGVMMLLAILPIPISIIPPIVMVCLFARRLP